MRLVLAMVCVLLPTIVLAQSGRRSEDYRAEVFAGYSFLSADGNGSPRENFNGWEASGALNLTKWLGAEGDLSGYYKGLGNIAGADVNAHDYLFGVGPRFTFRPLFLHTLFGVDHASASSSGGGTTVTVSQNAFAAVLGGGIEWKLARHWAVRPSFDYVLTRHGAPTAMTQNDIRFGVGLAYAFGR